MLSLRHGRPTGWLLPVLVTLPTFVGALPMFVGAQTGPRGGGEAGDHNDRRMLNPYAWPPLEEMVARADTIVAGEVVETTSAWNADHTDIFTTVILRTERRLHGRVGGQVRFQVPGGQVGDTRVLVTHMPTFRVGERALVFLRNSGPRLPRVVAGEAGKRSLIEDEDGTLRAVPGFDTGGADGATLDELASSLPAILAAASR